MSANSNPQNAHDPRRAVESGAAVVNLPNVLTVSRIILAIVAGALFLFRRDEILAVSMCLFGAVLDALDGWYARSRSACSVLGTFLDPIADKMLMAVVYGVIAVNLSSALVWTLFGLVTFRDVTVTVSRTRRYLSRGFPQPADAFGKAKMILQSVAGLAILVYAYGLDRGFGGLYYPTVFVFAAVTALAYVSAGRYLLSTRFPRGPK